MSKTWQRKFYLTFKIYLPLTIDVSKAVVKVWRLNSICGLSFCLSHHVTKRILLKNLSDVVKDTRAKTAKEIKSNLQNIPAAAH